MYTLQMFLGMGPENIFQVPKNRSRTELPKGKKAYSPNVFRSGLGMPCNHYFQAGIA